MNFCAISSKIVGPSGPVPGVLVRVRVGSIGFHDESARFAGAFVDVRAITIFTDSTGAFSFQVPQGAAFFIEAPVADLHHVGVAPYSATVDLSTLQLTYRSDA